MTFVATIGDITRRQGKYRRRAVTFNVEHVYHGNPPHTVVVLDVGGDCGELRPDQLHSGLRVIVTANRLQTSPISSFDHVLIWRQVAQGHWRFYQDALAFGYWGSYYPVAAREARTIEAILSVSDPSAMPDTAAVSATHVATGQKSLVDDAWPIVGSTAGGASLAWC
jgi:hypothetical protein